MKIDLQSSHWINPFFSLFFILAVFLLAIGIHFITANNTLGADFATFWIGAKTAVFEGKSPYSLEVTQISQNFIYHRLAFPGEDQVAFAYPLPAVFLIAPFAWMDIAWAQAFWMSLTIISLLTSLFLFLPQAPGYIRFSFFLFYPVVFGIILGNFTILFSAFILFFLSLVFVKKNSNPSTQIFSAILLGLTIVKPQFAWGFFLLAILTAIRNRYRPFLLFLLLIPAFQVILAFIWQPTWFEQWIAGIKSYSVYVNSKSALILHLERLLPPPLILPAAGLVLFLTVCLLVYLIFAWWRNKYSPALLPAWMGFMVYFIHPHGISYEQLTFIIPFFLWAALSTSGLKIKIIWFSSIVLSWLLYFLSAFHLIPQAVNEYPFLFYILWLIWFTINEWITGQKRISVLNPVN